MGRSVHFRRRGLVLLASNPYAALYVGVIIAGSSTLLVIKLFQENFELDTAPGRLGLGISIPAPDGFDVILLALGLAVLAIVARQLVFFPLFYWTGVDQRNAEVSSIRLAQISEFGLVLAFLGVQYGHLSPELSAAIIFAFVITALMTPLLYNRAYEIHGWLQPLIERLGFKAPPELVHEEGRSYRLALLGFHRHASSLLSDLAARDPELVRDTLVIDFNVAIHSAIRATGATVKYGDLSNSETLEHVGLSEAEVVVCTIPDDLLRGIDNRGLVRMVRGMNPKAVIIANGISFAEMENVYKAGADYIYMARLESAEALGEVISAALDNRVGEYREAALARFRLRPGRKEVLN